MRFFFYCVAGLGRSSGRNLTGFNTISVKMRFSYKIKLTRFFSWKDTGFCDQSCDHFSIKFSRNICPILQIITIMNKELALPSQIERAIFLFQIIVKQYDFFKLQFYIVRKMRVNLRCHWVVRDMSYPYRNDFTLYFTFSATSFEIKLT